MHYTSKLFLSSYSLFSHLTKPTNLLSQCKQLIFSFLFFKNISYTRLRVTLIIKKEARSAVIRWLFMYWCMCIDLDAFRFLTEVFILHAQLGCLALCAHLWLSSGIHQISKVCKYFLFIHAPNTQTQINRK